MDCFFELRYTGNWANQNRVEFYDVAQALVGFERLIALTTHMLIHGEAITQSPSAKGFRLAALPAEPGSWKWTIGLALGFGQTIHAFGTAPPDTAFGWLTKSAIEYTIQETLGFTPNFDETLGAQIKRYKSNGTGRQKISDDLSIERFDSLIEKTESGIKAIHRPIVKSASAEAAHFSYSSGIKSEDLSVYADQGTYEYVDRIITSEDFSEYCGQVSSYNTNTFKGRLYIPTEKRTIPFELAPEVRTIKDVNSITSSLSSNATARLIGQNSASMVCMKSLRNETQSGRLKSLYVLELNPTS